jgi:hypothetical protein
MKRFYLHAIRARLDTHDITKITLVAVKAPYNIYLYFLIDYYMTLSISFILGHIYLL